MINIIRSTRYRMACGRHPLKGADKGIISCDLNKQCSKCISNFNSDNISNDIVLRLLDLNHENV